MIEATLHQFMHPLAKTISKAMAFLDRANVGFAKQSFQASALDASGFGVRLNPDCELHRPYPR